MHTLILCRWWARLQRVTSHWSSHAHTTWCFKGKRGTCRGWRLETVQIGIQYWYPQSGSPWKSWAYSEAEMNLPVKGCQRNRECYGTRQARFRQILTPNNPLTWCCHKQPNSIYSNFHPGKHTQGPDIPTTLLTTWQRLPWGESETWMIAGNTDALEGTKDASTGHLHRNWSREDFEPILFKNQEFLASSSSTIPSTKPKHWVQPPPAPLDQPKPFQAEGDQNRTNQIASKIIGTSRTWRKEENSKSATSK